MTTLKNIAKDLADTLGHKDTTLTYVAARTALRAQPLPEQGLIWDPDNIPADLATTITAEATEALHGGIETPLETIEKRQQELDLAEAAVNKARDARDEAIREARKFNIPYQLIMRATGLKRSRVTEIANRH